MLPAPHPSPGLPHTTLLDATLDAVEQPTGKNDRTLNILAVELGGQPRQVNA